MKIVPINFGMVEEGIVRCGMPEPKNFPFLETLHLRTCVVLTDEGPDPIFAAWLRENGVRVIHHCETRISGKSTTVSESIVYNVLALLLNPENYPAMITCTMGRHRTGTVVGCLRKLQRWNLASILEEYRRYAGSKRRLENEEFIELFDAELVRIPQGVRHQILYQ